MLQTVIRKALVMFHATFKSGSLLAALLISTAAHAELTRREQHVAHADTRRERG